MDTILTKHRRIQRHIRRKEVSLLTRYQRTKAKTSILLTIQEVQTSNAQYLTLQKINTGITNWSLFFIEIIDRCSFNLRRTKDKTHTFTENGETVPLVTIEEKHLEVIEVEDEGISVKRDKNMAKSEKLSRKKPLTFENVKRKSDLVALLNKESYPGLDKLQWNMIRNKSKRLLNKLDAISDEAEQLISLERVIKRIQRWIA